MKETTSNIKQIKSEAIEIAKQLRYTYYFPEIEDIIISANTEKEITSILCTYRHKSIKKEMEKSNKKERNKINVY